MRPFFLVGKTNKPEGNGHILKFTKTAYEEVNDGHLVRSGTYEIIEEKFWAGNLRIIFDGDLTSLPAYMKISNDKLTIFKGAPLSLDGLETVYERK